MKHAANPEPAAGQNGLPLATTQGRLGVRWGIVAYGLWGIFPLYFHLLQGISTVEIVAHRVV